MMDESKIQTDAQQASNTATTPRLPTAGSRRCPNCGSHVSAHARVCPACGETLQDRGGRIRCRHCGESSPAELTICPSCGRELVSAPPRLFTWGIPVLLVALFLVLLVGQVSSGRNPLAWTRAQLSVERPAAGDQDPRRLVVVVTPVADGPQSNAAEQGDSTDTTGESDVVDASIVSSEAVTVVDVGSGPDTASASDSLSTSNNGPATKDVPVSEDGSAGDEIAERSAQTQDDEQAVSGENKDGSTAMVSIATAQVQSEVAPVTVETETTVENAVSDAPEELLVSSAGASETRNSLELPTSTPTSTRTATPNSTATSSPTATALITDTPSPTETATAVPMPTYQIQRGDTLIVIARKNDVSVEDLMRVNGISAAEAFSIQPGQELLIPVEGSQVETPVASTATEEPTAAPGPTSTPMPTPTTPSLRLDAPILRSPEPGTPVSCSAPGALAWLPVPFMRADDQFVLHLGFVNGQTEDGKDVVIWVLEQPFPASASSWDMDGSLCALAPQEYRRKWHWFVQVAEEVDGMLRPVSPPSKTWDFNWN